jgi:uncharacterized protein YukE
VSFSEKIRLVFDVDAGNATKGIRGLRTEVAAADGAFGKAKAGAGGLSNMLKQNMGNAAIVAGTALVTFGVKAALAFQNLALEAGKFADATGLAVDDASRWIEVAGDIGVEANTIQGSFQKMNKSIADGKAAWSDFGIEIARTNSGVVDANETFIQAATSIGAIEDPTLRAKAAQEVFGKSYAEVAELMELSADQLREKLDSVSDAKVIDQEELDKARVMRERMDSLSDAAQDLQLEAGETSSGWAAGLAKIAQGFTIALGHANDFNAALEETVTTMITGEGVMKGVSWGEKEIDAATDALGELLPALREACGRGGRSRTRRQRRHSRY